MPRRVRYVCWLLLAGFVFFFPSKVLPRATSFDAQTFKPAFDAGYYMTLHGARSLRRNQWNAGLYLDYSRDPLVLTQAGVRVGSVLTDLLAGHIYGGYGILDWLSVGLGANVSLYETLNNATTGTATHPARFGDTRLNFKFRALDPMQYPVGLAVIPYIDFPTGSGSNLAGNNSFAGGATIAAETKRLYNRFSIGLNLGYYSRDNVILTGGTRVDDMFTYGVGLNVMAMPWMEIITELRGATVTADFFQNAIESPLEVSGAFRFLFGKDRRMNVTIGGGGGATAGVGSPRFRVVGGFAYTPPVVIKERLGDASLTEAFEIYELVDKCPIDVGGYKVGRDDPRCTEVYELQDLAEKCPPRESFNPEKDDTRCLKVYLLREKDSDHDGVPDFKDRCPTQSGSSSEGGCPSSALVIISPEEGKILTQAIHFDFGEATIRPESTPILEALTGAIHAQPSIKKLSIEGHTDDFGSAEANQQLSWARARAVYHFLVDHGINPQRLEYRGRGEAYPVGDNRTELGRAKNRRVDFLIKRVEHY